MDEQGIFDLSRNIMGDAWELQILIEDANEAVGELDYEATHDEYKTLVNRIYRAVSDLEETARRMRSEIETRVPEGYLSSQLP